MESSSDGEGLAIKRSATRWPALRAVVLILGIVLLIPGVAQAAAPNACFTVSPASPQTGEVTTLNSSCSSDDVGITGRGWDLDNDGQFDDGTAVSVTKSWPTAGTYTVRLGVIDRSNNYDIETKTITVRNRPPVANFSISAASPNTATAITFTSTSSDPDGTIAGQRWALDADGVFNDGTGSSVTRTFATPGTYNVKLEVTDNLGATSTVTKTVTVANRGPTAAFTATPASAPTGQSFSFASTSTDPDGTIASQAWDTDGDATEDFNDGTGATASRSFATPGVYTIRLRVTDNNGAQNVTTRTVTVTNRGPTANFTISPAAPAAGQAMTFTSTSTDPDGTIASQAWDTDGDATEDFKDGTGTTATRAFTTPGTYTIRLRARDNNGAENIATKTVTVGNRLPVARFTWSPASPLTKQAVTLTSTSSDADGTIAAYAWDTDGDATADFGDGKGPTETVAFDKPGDHIVRLRVTDNSGGQNITTANVPVGNRPPVASFTISPSAILEGDTVTLTSTARDEDGTVRDQSWDLDNDGAYDDATGSTASFTAGAPGAYSVGLRVVDDKNSAQTATQTITVGQRLVPPPGSPTDARTDSGQQTFDISAPIVSTPSPAEPSPVSPVAPLRYLDPFPVVRLRGRTTGKGARLTAFTVRAPHGSLLDVRCSGRGCPIKKLRKKITTRRKRGSATVHVRQLERLLRTGIELQVRVTQPNMVGKYTRIKIRGLAVPIRSDRCLLPGSSKPAACPSAP
jgi:large repetitive protein